MQNHAVNFEFLPALEAGVRAELSGRTSEDEQKHVQHSASNIECSIDAGFSITAEQLAGGDVRSDFEMGGADTRKIVRAAVGDEESAYLP
jgi:hypothetical protein